MQARPAPVRPLAAALRASPAPPLARALVPALLGLALAGAWRLGPAAGFADDAARDLEAARRWEGRVQEAIAAVRSCVVTILVEVTDEQGGVSASGGSGVHLGEGWVLTCDHVTEGRDVVTVGLVDGRAVPGRIRGRDVTADVALLRLELPQGRRGAPPPAAALGDADALQPGDPVLALGNPFGLAREDHQPATTLGIVSAVGRFQGGRKLYADALQIDAAVNPGNSGGPLFDLDGRLVGLNGRISIRAGARHNVGVGFAIPIHVVTRILDDLKAGRPVARGFLGVRFFTTPEDRMGDGALAPGVRVREVVAGSPAAAAGLLPGDRIVAVDGQPVDHPVRLQNRLAILPAGETARLTVARGDRELTLTVTLAPRPEGP